MPVGGISGFQYAAHLALVAFNWANTRIGNLLPDSKCRNGMLNVLCNDCYDGFSICGGPCYGNTENCWNGQ